MPRVHVWVKGLVQGVFFRDSTRQAALRLGLAGWVRNLPDGRVEAVFQGDGESCRKALDFVRKGPPGARVSEVETEWEDEEKGLNDFRIRF
jgi:acylphosphatase